ncbi:MAG: PQQ-binding-like beta-propeller repeat protein [Planctomycetes bacterium]|nr:PQQ-binding-like beta-propeller repeat protein [Planctomycetota bacterium]
MSHRLNNMNCRRRSAIGALVIASVILGLSALGTSALAARRLVSDAEARHLGLQRAWTTQVRLDPARNRVERAVLEGDRLTVMTSAGVVQEFNALTGETMWIAPIGNPDHPSLGPSSSAKFVAVINGSTLYVLDKMDGKPIVVRPVGGAPGAAPAVGEHYVFVPLAMGRIEAYPLGEQKLTPWYYQSFGRAMVAPLATPESFVWSTDSGHLYVGRSADLGVRFRLETGSEIVASPAYGAPYVYAATSDGEVFSMHEMTGQRRWKYATGFPVTRAPAVVGDRVFVTSEEPMLHCIDATKGTAIWETPHIAQFAAASAKRVYGVDDLGALVVLDAATGALLGRMPTDSSTNALVNDQTDRVYLVSEDGVVQCLHELGAKEPMYHRPKVEPQAPQAPTSEGQPVEPNATTRPQPPADVEAEAPADEEAAPAEESEMPAEESAAGESEDPFNGIDQ